VLRVGVKRKTLLLSREGRGGVQVLRVGVKRKALLSREARRCTGVLRVGVCSLGGISELSGPI